MHRKRLTIDVDQWPAFGAACHRQGANGAIESRAAEAAGSLCDEVRSESSEVGRTGDRIKKPHGTNLSIVSRL
jgi:hypothetical protein